MVCGILLLAVLMGCLPLLKLAFLASFLAVCGGDIGLSFDGCVGIRKPSELLCCHLLVNKLFALCSEGEMGEIWFEACLKLCKVLVAFLLFAAETTVFFIAGIISVRVS